MPIGLKTRSKKVAGANVTATTFVTAELFSSVNKNSTGRFDAHPAAREAIVPKKHSKNAWREYFIVVLVFWNHDMNRITQIGIRWWYNTSVHEDN